MNELNKELRDNAISLGLCNEWQQLWQNDWSQEKMAEMMFRGLDFCLKNRYPSNDFIVNHFELDFRRKSNVFVDDKYSILNQIQCLILGNSEITARYNTWNHGNIYIRDNASLKLITKNRCFVIVHLFDEAYVTAEQLDKSKIVLIKHSDKVTIIADSNIKVKEEYNYLNPSSPN